MLQPNCCIEAIHIDLKKILFKINNDKNWGDYINNKATSLNYLTVEKVESECLYMYASNSSFLQVSLNIYFGLMDELILRKHKINTSNYTILIPKLIPLINKLNR